MIIIELDNNEIKELDLCKNAELIGNGWCGDTKYKIETADGKWMLLRISDIVNHDFNKKLYHTMKELVSSGVPVPYPVGFGMCNGNRSVYLLLEWCNGRNLGDLLPSLSEGERYRFGIEAGKILKKIHSMPSPQNESDWAATFIQGKLREFCDFNKCGIKIDGSNAIIQYFEDNKYLITNNRLCLHHGDFHAENLIISENGSLTVIDWDNYRYGDPWNDFMEIYNAEMFSHFMTGLFRGYFNGEPPSEFWSMLALYLSSAVLASVSWAVANAPAYVEICVKNVYQVLQAFDYMKNVIPNWYVKDYWV